MPRGERLLVELQERQRLAEEAREASLRNLRRKVLLSLAWLFILAVAFFDGYFAWKNRQDFPLWEDNEIAIYLYGLGDIWLILGVKFFGLGLTAWLTTRLSFVRTNYLITFLFLVYSWVALRYLHLYVSLGEYVPYVF